MYLTHNDSGNWSVCGFNSTLCCFFWLSLVLDFLKCILWCDLHSLELYLWEFFKTNVKSSVMQQTSNTSSSVSMLEMHIIRPCNRSIESECLGMGPRNLFIHTLKWLLCTLKFEVYRSTGLNCSSREDFCFFSQTPRNITNLRSFFYFKLFCEGKEHGSSAHFSPNLYENVGFWLGVPV